MNEVKRISAKEFRDRGYLQEVNRCFLHPLGMALEVILDEGGNVSFGGVWDYRDDPEGMRFGDDMIDAEKAKRVELERRQKFKTRTAALGYFIQPTEEVPSVWAQLASAEITPQDDD